MWWLHPPLILVHAPRLDLQGIPVYWRLSSKDYPWKTSKKTGHLLLRPLAGFDDPSAASDFSVGLSLRFLFLTIAFSFASVLGFLRFEQGQSSTEMDLG